MLQKQHGGLVFVLLVALTACTPKEKQASPDQPSTQAPAEAVRVTPAAKAPPPPVKPLSMLPGATPFDPKLAQRLEDERKNSSESTWHHTRNKNTDGSPKFVNRLILETSPYLQQHSFNPINWQAWSQDAIDEAKLRDVPILLSVGYTTCHWCHVMARESFEDVAIAAYLNQNYVCIKVDREERPDVDRVYMQVVQMLAGRGGWPMTVIMTPELEPLFAGTYFPPEDRGGRKGFLTILKKVNEMWTKDSAQVRSRAKEIAQRLINSSKPRTPSDFPGPESSAQTAKFFLGRHDDVRGGYSNAPKFPRPSTLFFMLREYARSGDEEVKKSLVRTLDAMAMGGMHDHAAGGFHRYSVDTNWRVPHFEKMLYDNAHLSQLYLEASIGLGLPRYAYIAHKTYAYMLRELQAPDGGFVSGTDADSLAPGSDHAEEGYYHTWTPSEVHKVLDTLEGTKLINLFNVTPRGNFEHGRSILYLDGPWEVDGKTALEEAFAMEPELQKLRNVRELRPSPETDGKRVTAWNAFTVSSFARASWLSGKEEYLKIAQQTMVWLLRNVWRESPDGARTLYRTYHRKRVNGLAVVNDYAAMISALLDLFEADGNSDWLVVARRLHDEQDKRFLHKATGRYFQIPEESKLLVRSTNDYDGAEPAGNSMTAWNLVRFAALFPDQGFEHKRDTLFRAMGVQLTRAAGAIPFMMDALAVRHSGLRELVIATPEGKAKSAAPLLEILQKDYASDVLHVVVSSTAQRKKLQGVVPWVEGKIAVNNQAMAYLCRNRVCKRPTADPAVLRKLLIEH